MIFFEIRKFREGLFASFVTIFLWFIFVAN
nr:MAG TPA: hypothetical protein [Caudoviricetes sp.]